MPERAHRLQQEPVEYGTLAAETERRLAVAVGTGHVRVQVQPIRTGAAERMMATRLDVRLAVHRSIELVRLLAVQLSLDVKRVTRRLLTTGQVLVQTVAQIVQVVGERTAARWRCTVRSSCGFVVRRVVGGLAGVVQVLAIGEVAVVRRTFAEGQVLRVVQLLGVVELL